jgi:hypothetical protein
MASRGSRTTESGTSIDQRRTADRRKAPRVGSARGRRATDAVESPSTAGGDKAGGERRKRRATSDGREPLVIYLRPESIKALKMAALERDSTASAIMVDALEMWFRANGRRSRA